MSLRREDAARLGFDNGCRWRDMLRTQTQTLSDALKIPMENLRWYAAFHNESHHPHIHLIAYSVNESEGYLSPKGVNKLRSSIAKDIFHQDLLSVYEKQTEHRNTLKSETKELIAELITKINNGIYDNPAFEEKLTLLAKRLSNTSGKKVYGYLKSDVKDLIDSIVDEVAKDERVSALYNLWYEYKEEVLLAYSQSLPKRVPLSQNKEFKSVRNTVIEEAMNIVMKNALTDETLGDELPDPDYYITETDDVQIDPADEFDNITEKTESSDKWRLYALAKRLLDRETEYYNPSEAVHCLIQAAMQNLSVAKYRLGKLFLKGEDVPQNSTYALYWLEEAVKDDNPYAEYLLGKVYLKGEYVDKDIEKAIELLKSSANQNNKYAAYTLGKLYLDGTTAPQDIEQALKYLTRSADNGFATAQYLLGKLLYSGELMPININKALEYLLSAAEQADPFAAYLAGKIMLNEDSVKNIKEAVRCFEIAAEQGNSYAEYQLGKIYLYGVDKAQEESARRKAKAPQSEKVALTASGKYSKYALTEVMMCGECGSRYKRVTWSIRGRRRIVGRCMSRLDYGKKYCADSITVDEQALQRAIVRALNRFNIEDESIYLMLMKSTIGKAIGINGGSDEIDLLERRIDALNKRMLDLVTLSVQEDNDAENYEDEFKNISMQIVQLSGRITAIRESESEDGELQARIKEIQDTIDKRKENKDTYDDSIVRQMVECIKAYRDGRLQIILGGGYELEEYLEK